MPDRPAPHPPHRYGGQAVLHGVMVRGADRWAVAVRRPDGAIWLESHPVVDPNGRPRWQRLPLVRGTFALGDSLRVGLQALRIAADQALAAEARAPEGGIRMGRSLLLAALAAIALFVLLPTAATKAIDAGLAAVLGAPVLGDGVAFHVAESVLRIGVLLGYLWGVSQLPDIRRTFEYHGAEHQTIAAHEHGVPLSPSHVQRFSTRHVRCGTNFLLLVMVLAIVVTSVGGALIPPPAEVGLGGSLTYHVLLRLVLLPLLAGLAYEGLRLGASAGDQPLVRALMTPGLWLQAITTRRATDGQVEVAIRAFEAAAREDDLAEQRTRGLPSEVVLADTGLPIQLPNARVRRAAPAVSPPEPEGPGDR